MTKPYPTRGRTTSARRARRLGRRRRVKAVRFDRLPAQQVLLDDLFQNVRRAAAIPDIVGPDDGDGPVGTDLQAIGLGPQHRPAIALRVDQTQFLHPPFEIGPRPRALLARAQVSPESRLFCFGFANPCPALTHTPPPTNLLLWWHEGRSFSPDNPPPGALDDVTLVLVPKVDRFGFSEAIEEAYGAELARQFEPVAQSTFWRLWQRRSASPSAS